MEKVTPTRSTSLEKFVCLVALLVALAAQADTVNDQQSGAVSVSAPKFRLVRSISGSKGTEKQGQFVFEDPRSIFYVPDDRQVIGYFEWDGVPGTYRFEGIWKNPEGKVVVISDLQYEAKQNRFAVYWTLLLSESAPAGLWLLEARINGELAGAHNFQVIAAPRPALPPPPPAPLTTAEIYRKILDSTVQVESLGAGGERLDVGSGFLVDGIVLTSFQILDGARSLRVTFPDGQRVETSALRGYSRRQDWAILALPAIDRPGLLRAKADSWDVGDRCFFLNVTSEGGRVITDASITGKKNHPNYGERLNISFPAGSATVGSPLVNEFGHVIGIIGGSLIPGARSIANDRVRFSTPAIVYAGALGAGLAVPLPLVVIPSPQAIPKPLADLAAAGEFIPPVEEHRHVAYGTLARSIERPSSGGIPWPTTSQHSYFRSDKTMSVFVMWEPRAKRKGLMHVRIYDLENRKLGEAKPAKYDFKPNQKQFLTWTISIASLLPGTYRVDVLLDTQPAWRTFFEISD